MKPFKTICVASASCLMMASCVSKEAELYNQIKIFPSSALIAEYIAECPEGEHIDSVKGYYTDVVNRINVLADTTDYQAYLNVHDSVAIDSVKTWALIKADTLLLDSINRNGTAALCETYIKYFPKSKNLSAIEAKFKELKEKEQIDQMLKEFSIAVNGRGRLIWIEHDEDYTQKELNAYNRYCRKCYELQPRLKKLRSKMSKPQRKKFDRLDFAYYWAE